MLHFRFILKYWSIVYSGTGSSSLQAFMALIDMEMEEFDDDFLNDDDHDEFDDEYERLQYSASQGVMKTLEERLADAERNVNTFKEQLDLSEKHVSMQWLVSIPHKQFLWVLHW